MGVVSVPSQEEFDTLKARVQALELQIENWKSILNALLEDLTPA